MNNKVFVAILNWNGESDTIECLESLMHTNYKNFEILLVDNNSSLKSQQTLKGWLDSQKTFRVFNYEIDYLLSDKKLQNSASKSIHFLINSVNHGFANGNNLAADIVRKSDSGAFILLLNNDTTVDENFLSPLVDVLSTNKRICAVSPIILDYYKKEKVLCFGGKINLFFGTVKHFKRGAKLDVINTDFNVNFLEGSAMLVRLSALGHSRLLDDRFFAYFEDADFCISMKKKGLELRAVASSRVWHKVSRSSNPPKKAFYLLRNSIWFMKKNSNLYQYLIFLAFLPVKILYLLTCKYRFSPQYASAVLRALFDGLSNSIFYRSSTVQIRK